MASPVRNLVLVLGDQLDIQSAAFDHFHPQRDRIWMAEVEREAAHVWCHKQRLVFFFSAMRHFRNELNERGWKVEYHELKADPGEDRGKSFGEILVSELARLRPERVILVAPGDWRVREEFCAVEKASGTAFEHRPDRHFYLEPDQFAAWATGRKGLVLENFYRWMRQQFDILLEPDGQPAGGSWNFDHDNREPFPKAGPPPAPRKSFPPDKLTRKVMAMVATRFAGHPGDLDGFDWPVTREEARTALDDFIRHRLPGFGRFQDAMWAGEPVLHHSRLSAPMNVKLLSPREAVEATLGAWQAGRVPLNSAEGFIRQIIGWREFVRGVYWLHMPGYAALNELGCDQGQDVPRSFWTGETEMNCVREAMRSVIDGAWGHHIHRLMVLGLYAQLLGVHPRKFHDWHMAMYADAIDWVSLPNTLGMSQYGDGGIMATKPYCASGNYIHKMSNYCRGCRYDYSAATGPGACPMTTLYWDFLDRHRARLVRNGRMLCQIRNLERKAAEVMKEIRAAASQIREQEFGQ
jgi:deoxyribodipyrimidine photolyase-related protein